MHLAERAWRHLRATGRAMRAPVLGFVLAVLLPGPLLYAAEDLRFFRIGTGSTAGTYFPIGGLIASAISKPPGSRECDAGGSCGVPGLIAVAQSTQGSVANVQGISDGSLDSGLSQADVAFWAYNGEGVFKAWGPFTKLRTVANLFPESIHLVVRRGAGIFNVRDLKGKRISLDREGSGTRVDALLILKAYGLGPNDLRTESVAVGDAADLLRAGELDGFFMVVGTPATAITHLANDSLITLVPITGPEADALRTAYPFFAKEEISAGTYFNVPATETLSVGAQWLVSADVPENIVYEITRALWHENTRRLLDNGHPKGRLITPATALTGLVVPLHPGARRYYSEAKTPFPGKID
ncbi:MAG: TAXI family TRAP transporter solute-binding subunit [Kiloniellales bacterium]